MASARLSRRLRVFIDSSVLIAAAISSTGAAREVIVAGLRGELLLSISTLVLEETSRNLARKAPAALPAFEVFRAALTPDLAEPRKAAVLRVAKVVEMKDAPIVAGAIRARASYLATYDRKHLLHHKEKIKERFGVTVALPDEVLAVLREQLG